MNKIMRKAMVLALAGTMTVGMGTTVFADNTTNLNISAENISDTSTINLLKDYVNGSADQQKTKSPEETFTFTIERYGLWNVGENGQGEPKYTKENMPTFSSGDENTFSIKADAGAAGTTSTTKPSVQLAVPTYEAVGDYWYKVTETNNNVAGVIYGTNDSQLEDTTKANGNHNAVYYIHVQVTNATTKGSYIRTVTLHKTAPGADVTTNAGYEIWYKDNDANTTDQTDKKASDIQNKYYAGSLKITKEVKGNAGDKNELFKVTVAFKNESGASMKSDITYKNFYDGRGSLTDKATLLEWKDTVTNSGSTTIHTTETKTVEFYVKDGTTVAFDNIPYGVTYTITETQPEDDKYTHEFRHTNEDAAVTFDGVSLAADAVTAEGSTGNSATDWNTAKATGSIADDSDTVIITNTKTSTIDVGVVTSNAPYIAILIFAGAAAVLYIRRRKDLIEE